MNETKVTQSKFKSKLFWVGIISIFMLLGGNYGLWDLIGMTSETFQTLANLVLGTLGIVGVVNDPTDPNKL